MLQWDSENIYLILEWCSGGDLSRFIRSRRILPERVARLFLQQMGEAHMCVPQHTEAQLSQVAFRGFVQQLVLLFWSVNKQCDSLH